MKILQGSDIVIAYSKTLHIISDGETKIIDMGKELSKSFNITLHKIDNLFYLGYDNYLLVVVDKSTNKWHLKIIYNIRSNQLLYYENDELHFVMNGYGNTKFSYCCYTVGKANDYYQLSFDKDAKPHIVKYSKNIYYYKHYGNKVIGDKIAEYEANKPYGIDTNIIYDHYLVDSKYIKIIITDLRDNTKFIIDSKILDVRLYHPRITFGVTESLITLFIHPYQNSKEIIMMELPESLDDINYTTYDVDDKNVKVFTGDEYGFIYRSKSTFYYKSINNESIELINKRDAKIAINSERRLFSSIIILLNNYIFNKIGNIVIEYLR